MAEVRVAYLTFSQWRPRGGGIWKEQVNTPLKVSPSAWEGYADMPLYLNVGLREGACASSPHSPHHIYLYGGYCEGIHQGSLYRLSLQDLQWTELSSKGDRSPMPKYGCGMVQYDGSLCVFGGYGRPPLGPTQPGAEFVKGKDGAGWTNELHVFDLSEGEGV